MQMLMEGRLHVMVRVVNLIQPRITCEENLSETVSVCVSVGIVLIALIDGKKTHCERGWPRSLPLSPGL